MSPLPYWARLYPDLLKPCRGVSEALFEERASAFAFYLFGRTQIFLRECFALKFEDYAIAWKGVSEALFEERASAFGEKTSDFCF
jgi:hypothetical protein